MTRTQILLTEELHRELRRWAAARGISLSEAVRRCVAEKLAAERAAGGREEQVRSALALLGKYEDPEGASRVGLDHDDHLAGAYGR